MSWDPTPTQSCTNARAVQSHRVGLLISGTGLLWVAALAMHPAVWTRECLSGGWPNVHSFAIGLEGSPDLAAPTRGRPQHASRV